MLLDKKVKKYFCNKCKRYFWPRIDDITNEIIKPKVCRYQDCKSPSWDDPNAIRWK